MLQCACFYVFCHSWKLGIPYFLRRRMTLVLPSAWPPFSSRRLSTVIGPSFFPIRNLISFNESLFHFRHFLPSPVSKVLPMPYSPNPSFSSRFSACIVLAVMASYLSPRSGLTLPGCRNIPRKYYKFTG